MESRDCDADFPGERRSSATNGACDCRDGTMDVRGKCVESTIVAIVISGLALVFITVIGIFILRYKNYKNDQYVLFQDTMQSIIHRNSHFLLFW